MHELCPRNPATGLKRVGRFALHFVEMCGAMCLGFALGDAAYFWLAGLAGCTKPFRELPELSVALAATSATAKIGGRARATSLLLI